MKIEILNVQPAEALAAMKPEALRKHFPAQLAKMSRSVSGSLRQISVDITHILTKTFERFLNYIGLLVCVDRSPQLTSSIDNNGDKYDKLLLRVFGRFRILQVTKLTLKVDKNGTSNTTSID